MAKVKFFLDEHIPKAVAKGLLLLHEVLEGEDMIDHVEFLPI
jgi:hypothetical protein